MSDTPIDMAKVCQMLDNGWEVFLRRGGMGGYVAVGIHENHRIWHLAKEKEYQQLLKVGWGWEEAKGLNDADWCNPGIVDTEDFTPEQALTRLAYKVHGEII